MYDIILDPDINGCSIWYNGKVTYIRGRINEVVENIYKRVSIFEKTNDNKYICYQNKTVGIDTSGIGTAIKTYLESKGLQVYSINIREIDNILPITNKLLVPISKTN